MAKLTRSGVAYDLKMSPHKLVVKYGEHDFLTYIFSSEFYKNKFSEKMYKNREEINESLTKRFGITIRCDKLADIKLYSRTEKRGFFIQGKEDYECLEHIRLDGGSLMNRS